MKIIIKLKRSSRKLTESRVIRELSRVGFKWSEVSQGWIGDVQPEGRQAFIDGVRRLGIEVVEVA